VSRTISRPSVPGWFAQGWNIDLVLTWLSVWLVRLLFGVGWNAGGGCVGAGTLLGPEGTGALFHALVFFRAGSSSQTGFVAFGSWGWVLGVGSGPFVA
jgi:hypothetical protein